MIIIIMVRDSDGCPGTCMVMKYSFISPFLLIFQVGATLFITLCLFFKNLSLSLSL